MDTKDYQADDVMDYPGYEDLNRVIEQPKLSMKEIAFRTTDLSTLYAVSQVRESPLIQFDGMGYTKYNETNEMADMSFIAPKKNKMESRLVTGVTHEKDSSLLGLLTDMNYEVRWHAFDEDDNELYELGESLTCMTRKSRELENYDEKRPIYYRNMLVQGTAFVRERYLEQFVPDKEITGAIDFTSLDKTKWKDKGDRKIYDGCVTEFVDGKKVFMEDIRVQNIRLQPGVYTIEYVPRERAWAMFKHFERWKNVPKSIAPTQSGILIRGSIYSDWTFYEIDSKKVEIIEVMKKFENRYQIYFNGVPMLPADFPLTAISPSGEYPIAKGDLDPINMFAYSKSIPAKTKVDQAVFDQMLRIMLIKFQQTAFPPAGNNSDVILNENVWMPGRFTANVRKEDISILTPHEGLTQGDFSFYKTIQELIDSKSVSKMIEGNMTPTSDMTLGQYMDMQKKQLLKLGCIFDAFQNWEKQMAYLRLNNIIANWTREVDVEVDAVRGKLQKIYRQFSIEDTFSDGRKGKRVVKFTPNTSEADQTSQDIFDQELAYTKKTGKEVRYNYINPDILRTAKLTFYPEIVPVNKTNDKLSQLMFIQSITQAAQIFGMQSLNVEYLKKRYAQVFDEDFDKFFLRQMGNPVGNAPMPNIAQQMMQPGQGNNAQNPAQGSANGLGAGVVLPSTPNMGQAAFK